MHTITKYIQRLGGKPIPVYALPTMRDGFGGQVYVGHAASWTEALALLRRDGYRVMHKGGYADVTAYDGIESVLVTVYPNDRNTA